MRIRWKRFCLPLLLLLVSCGPSRARMGIAHLGEKVEAWSGEFFDIDSVSIVGGVLTCSGSFDIRQADSSGFYSYVEYWGYEAGSKPSSAETLSWGCTDNYWLSSGKDGKISLSGESSVVFSVSDSFASLLQDKIDAKLFVTFGIKGKDSDTLTNFVATKEEISFQ